eukprot:7174787-Pyramimonas_sp.AAC.1
MASGDARSSATRTNIDRTRDGRNYEWMSRETMVTKLGKHKAEAKIASNKLETRADQDTGLMDEYSLEYKVWIGAGKEETGSDNAHSLD